MKKRYITTSLLLLASLLLGGCSENRNNSAHAGDTSNASVSSTKISQPESIAENSSMDSSTQSTPESFPELVPVEFTDEDRELQKILSDLLPPAAEIFFWFVGPVLPTPLLDFIFPQFEKKTTDSFALVPEHHEINGTPFEIPTTRDGMKETMLKYYSARYTESRVEDIATGTMTENPDGTYSVIFTDGIDQFADGFFSKFLEIDGRLYRRDGIKTTSINMDYSTAKIVNKTDDTIEFTYLLNEYSYEPKPEYKNEPLYSENALKGVLKYERGGWKLDSWGDPINS